MQARRGELIDVLEGEGLVATTAHGIVGVITWLVENDPAAARATVGATEVGGSAEVRALAIASATRGRGFGRALLGAAEEALRAAGVRRAWLVTTNDNLSALALYQKARWRLSALRPGAIDELRRTVKPRIGIFGQHGIPLRDELELQKRL